MLADPQTSVEGLVRSPDDPVLVLEAQPVRRRVEMQIGWAGQFARARTQERDLIKLLDQARGEEALVVIEKGLEPLRRLRPFVDRSGISANVVAVQTIPNPEPLKQLRAHHELLGGRADHRRHELRRGTLEQDHL